jgi:hypothetical protein
MPANRASADPMSLCIAKELTSQTVPIVRCLDGRKPPHANRNGTWDTCDDPDMVQGWLQPGDNLAVLLGEAKGSPIIGVGLDYYKTPAVMDRARELGITFKGNSWSQKTGRGGYTLFYVYDGPALKRDTSGCDGTLDLLVSGYSIVAPSNTAKEPQGGGPYKWLPRHSPFDIPIAQLDTPPKALLDWWQSLSTPKQPETRKTPGEGYPPNCLTGPIPEGQRNEVLTKRAGYYHRMIPNDEVVRDLVHTANRAECLPPLPDREVDTILNSILKREGASHFRGVKPAKLEAVP